MSKFALLIGVSEYLEGENPLSALPAALNDVRALSVVLEDSNIGEFDEVTVLENPSAWQIRSKIEALFADRSADDLVLLYFSGHGITDQQGNFFFSTPKTYKNQKGFLVKSSAVPAQEVHGYMDDCASDRMVVILDCCHSGAFGDLILRDAGEIKFEPQLGGRGRVVLTASSAIDYSYERSGEELAVYTRYLIEGIRSGAADRDEDGYVSADELHDYVVEKLEKAAPGMSPQRYVKRDGEKIHLTKAIVADPTRRYRKAVKQYSRNGVIRPAGRGNLAIERQKLGLTIEAAEAVEADELRPYREYKKHLEEYEKYFREELEFLGGVLDEQGREELNDLIKQRSLKADDVTAIEHRVIQEFDRRTSPQSTILGEPNQRIDFQLSIRRENNEPIPLSVAQETSQNQVLERMTEQPKRKRILIQASVKGVQRADDILKWKGTSSIRAFAKAHFLGQSSVNKFLSRQPMSVDSFLKICDALEVSDWRELAELESVLALLNQEMSL